MDLEMYVRDGGNLGLPFDIYGARFRELVMKITPQK